MSEGGSSGNTRMARCALLIAVVVVTLLHSVTAQTGAASVKEFLQDAQFSAFMQLIQSQGLVEALDAKPYTVFAPTNEGFDKFYSVLKISANESDSMAMLLESFPIAGLLRYHFAPQPLLMDDLPHGQNIQTYLKSESDEDKLRIYVDKQAATPAVIFRGWESEARVVTANVKAGQSVVHVLDNVLLPRLLRDPGFYPPNVVDVLTFHSLGLMKWAVEASGLMEGLMTLNKSVTLMAPTDEAIKGAMASMNTTLDGMDKGLLTNLVKYHVADGLGTTSRMMQNGTVFTWLPGRVWNFQRDGDKVQVVSEKNTANFVIKDSFSGSGCVVHVIDQVLFPLVLGGSEEPSG